MDSKTQHHEHAYPTSQPSTVKMKMLTATDTIHIGENARLLFRPVDGQQPELHLPLSVQHEAVFHLIVVNSALTVFQHLHPEADGQGNYAVDLVFDRADTYFLYADYQVLGLPPQTDRIRIVLGQLTQAAVDEPHEQHTALADGLQLALQPAAPFVAQAESQIPVRITKESATLTAADIQPYLGAVAHIILIHADSKEFLHIHPMSDDRFPIIGHTVFPQAGIYRMWVQFKTGEALHTARFTLHVNKAPSRAHQHHTHHH